MSRLELTAADEQRFDTADIVLERALRAGLIEVDAAQPAQVRLGPVALGAVEADVTTQQQLGRFCPMFCVRSG